MSIEQELHAEVKEARELLAVIHRDGGHHREEYGLSSYEAAIALVIQHRSVRAMVVGVLEGALDHGHGWVPSRTRSFTSCAICRAQYLLAPDTVEDYVREAFRKEVGAAI